MATQEALLLFLSSLDKKNYYEVLRAGKGDGAAGIKAAFHAFSLLYHPDCYVDSPKEIRETASEIYKRGVEAYRCLARAVTRERYDRALARGKIRLEPWLPSSRPPPAPASREPVRTLETIAQTVEGKKFADKADRFISAGLLDDARVQLVSACQCEPHNVELAERLRFLYDALALEPP